MATRPKTRQACRAATQSSCQRGYGYDWQQLREKYLNEHPYCVLCLCRGRLTYGADMVVDHIRPHRGQDIHRLDWDNLQALCAVCHDADKGTIEGRTEHDADVRAAWFLYLAGCIKASLVGLDWIRTIRSHLPEPFRQYLIDRGLPAGAGM